MTYPRISSRLARWVPVCVWACLMSGCAITAPATAWQPAQIDVDGMQQLCVIEFSGEHGRSVAAALTARLWENEFYTLVDAADLSPIRVASASGIAGAVQPADYLDSARGEGVDGLIVGDVIEYRCDDQILSSTDVHVSTGQTSDSEHDLHSSGTDFGVSHTQTIHREASVSIAFRLVEVETGKVRATRKTTQTFQGDFGPDSTRLPARGDVLDELTQKCIDEFVAMLAPHEVVLQFPLARSHLFQRGQTLVAKGNDFARRGRWDEAIAAWQQAIQINPSNDGALYNLAMAHAAQSDFCQAEDYAIRAMNLKHRDLYADGLDQIRSLAAAHEQTLRQRQQARVIRVSPRPQQMTSTR
jgi:curli biogenesis system outer membrane secretion channel CsgG